MAESGHNLKDDNPISHFVLENHANPSVNSFANLAESAGVTPQVITKIARGLYVSIPPSVGEVLVANSEWSMQRWQAEYNFFIEYKLASMQEQIRNGKVEALAFYVPAADIPARYDSFSDWRRSFNESLVGFCIDFCIPHASMVRYETGLAVHLPGTFRQRMEYFGLSSDYLSALAKLPRKYEEIDLG